MFLVPVRRNSASLSRSLDRLFDDSFERFLNATVKTEQSASLRTPSLQVSESDTAYEVKLDLPGIAKEDVKISIDGRRVSIEAKAAAPADKKDGERVLYSERSVAQFSRSFVLPAEVNQADSAAKMDLGVLTLTLTKRQVAGATQLAVS
jgi:HSP20 family protein